LQTLQSIGSIHQAVSYLLPVSVRVTIVTVTVMRALLDTVRKFTEQAAAVLVG